MDDALKLPKTLLEAVRHFSQPGVALRYLTALRFPSGPYCPKCGCVDEFILWMPKVERWHCRGCRKQFSIKTGTVMEDSPLRLDIWLCAIWMLANCKNGISSYEIHRALGITQKSAWFLLHRIRHAMQEGFNTRLSGPVQTDETFIGGRVSNMKKSKRKDFERSGRREKSVVSAVYGPAGDIRAKVLPSMKMEHVGRFIRENVREGATLYTDAMPGYAALEGEYRRESVNHWNEEYARGDVTVNAVEGFWSCLKRSLKGTYICASPWHLQRYVDEQAHRFNLRETNDARRFEVVAEQLPGKRLTYKALKAVKGSYGWQPNAEA